MTKVRIQLYYDDKSDSRVEKLVESFEVLGDRQRGYTAVQLKECLKVYQMLSERSGILDPIELFMYYDDLRTGKVVATPQAVIEKPKEVSVNHEYAPGSEEVSEELYKLMADGDDNFGL